MNTKTLKQQEREAMIRQNWADKCAEALQNAEVAELLRTKRVDITPQGLWLLFALVERDEDAAYRGEASSATSRSYDSIAPRARPPRTPYGPTMGVQGFCAKMAQKNPKFLKASGNGYIYFTDAGLALVQQLRLAQPVLLPDAISPDMRREPLPVRLLDISLPNLNWRTYRS